MGYMDDKKKKRSSSLGETWFLRQFFSSPNEVFRGGGHDLCLYFACTGGNAYKEPPLFFMALVGLVVSNQGYMGYIPFKTINIGYISCWKMVKTYKIMG